MGQEDGQELFDLPEAHAGRECDGGKPLEHGLIEEHALVGVLELFGDGLEEVLILEAKASDLGIGLRLIGEPLFELSSVLVDGLATASGLVGLLRDRAMSA